MDTIPRAMIHLAVLWVVTGPLLTMLHEAGHGVAALLLSRGQVSVSVGPAHGRWSFRAGRIRFDLTPLYGPVGFYSYQTDQVSRVSRTAILIAGPLVSLLSGIALIAVDGATPVADSWVRDGRNWALLQFLLTAIPMHYPPGWGPYGGVPSDGLRLVRLWRSDNWRSLTFP